MRFPKELSCFWSLRDTRFLCLPHNLPMRFHAYCPSWDFLMMAFCSIIFVWDFFFKFYPFWQFSLPSFLAIIMRFPYGIFHVLPLNFHLKFACDIVCFLLHNFFTRSADEISCFFCRSEMSLWNSPRFAAFISDEISLWRFHAFWPWWDVLVRFIAFCCTIFVRDILISVGGGWM